MTSTNQARVAVITGASSGIGAVATELHTHITHAATRQGAEQLYSQVQVTAEDIAEVIAFAVSRPRRLAIHEVLLRPAGQEL